MKRFFIHATLGITALTSCGGNDKAYDATGTFEATEVTVSAQAAGELIRFSITEGEQIEANILVGNIDATQLELQREQLGTKDDVLNTSDSQLGANDAQFEANIEQLAATQRATEKHILDLEKQLASLRQQITNARHEQQRYQELVSDGAAPRKMLDDATNQVAVLEKQLAATTEQLSKNNASLKEQSKAIEAQIEGVRSQRSGIDAQRQGIVAKRRDIGVQKKLLTDKINHTQVRTPLSGTILEKYVEQGEFVSTGKPLFKIADTKNMFLRAYVTSSQLQSIKVGQKVTVFADYGDSQKKEYQGTVSWISSRSEFTPKTIVTDDERADLVYAVKIAVRNDGYVKIGMYGEVKF